MNEEELYKLAISDVPKYPLLNEILAIRDKRFPDEETDYTINVYGSISLDVLNKDVETIKENQQLKERIAYLERSNNRREETIIEYRMSETPILDELEKWLNEYLNREFPDCVDLKLYMFCEMVMDKIKELRGRE